MTALLAFLSLLIFTPDLTRTEVKRLVDAGISDDVIVSYIRAHGPVQPPLSAQDLIDLRQANFSEKVLAAMVESAKMPARSETSEVAPTVTYSYPWYYPSGYYNDYTYGPSVSFYVGYPYYYPYYRYPYYYPYYSYPYYGHYPYYPYYPYHNSYPYSAHNYRNNPTHPPTAAPHSQSTPHSSPHSGHR